MPEPALRFIAVVEARADGELASVLADRVWQERGPRWLRDQDLDHLRSWVGLDGDADFLLWRNVKAQADAAGIHVHGHFDGKPGCNDAAAGRRALLLVARARPDGVVLLRDADRDDERAVGLRQARDDVAARA